MSDYHSLYYILNVNYKSKGPKSIEIHKKNINIYFENKSEIQTLKKNNKSLLQKVFFDFLQNKAEKKNNFKNIVPWGGSAWPEGVKCPRGKKAFVHDMKNINMLQQSTYIIDKKK